MRRLRIKRSRIKRLRVKRIQSNSDRPRFSGEKSYSHCATSQPVSWSQWVDGDKPRKNWCNIGLIILAVLAVLALLGLMGALLIELYWQ